MKEIIDAETAKLAGLQIDQLQKLRSGQITLDHLGWFNNLTKEQRDYLAEGEIITIDPRFVLSTTFQVTVPNDYGHSTQLASFSKENREKFYHYNDAITDKNFAKATQKLAPGKTYTVKIFQITRRVSSENCLAFLRTQKAILIGVQGISLAWQHARDKFPVGKWTVSFDEREALWEDAVGSHRVPYVDRNSGGARSFDLGHFEHDWHGDHCLLCFCENN